MNKNDTFENFVLHPPNQTLSAKSCLVDPGKPCKVLAAPLGWSLSERNMTFVLEKVKILASSFHSCQDCLDTFSFMGTKKNPRIISHSSLLKPLGQLQRFHCPSLWKHLATPHSNMQKKLAVVTTQGDHHSWQPGVQHHWKWKIGECTIEQAVYSAYLLFTSIV